MAWRAGLILSEGGSVVADAVFDRPADRERIEAQARGRGLPFLGIWLDADPAVLWQRVSARRGGPSDATVDILSRQLERQADEIGWKRLDASRRPAAIVADILAAAATAAA
jgi:predicted kinase